MRMYDFRMRWFCFLLGVLVPFTFGCKDTTQPTSSLDEDQDRDGFTERQGDCNDTNAHIHPNGEIQFGPSRFEPDRIACPQWPNPNLPPYQSTPQWKLELDATNNRCETVAITGGRITNPTLEEQIIAGIRNEDTFSTRIVEMTPSSLAPGSETSILLTTVGIGCESALRLYGALCYGLGCTASPPPGSSVSCADPLLRSYFLLIKTSLGDKRADIAGCMTFFRP
jgi:hypothetical protein